MTKNGRPVSRLVPFREKPESLWGLHRESLVIQGDVVSPLDIDWEAGR